MKINRCPGGCVTSLFLQPHLPCFFHHYFFQMRISFCSYPRSRTSECTVHFQRLRETILFLKQKPVVSFLVHVITLISFEFLRHVKSWANLVFIEGVLFPHSPNSTDYYQLNIWPVDFLVYFLKSLYQRGLTDM